MKIVTVDMEKLQIKLYPPPPPIIPKPVPPPSLMTSTTSCGGLSITNYTSLTVHLFISTNSTTSNVAYTSSTYKAYNFMENIPNTIILTDVRYKPTNRFLFNSESEELINFLFEHSDCILSVSYKI